MAPIDWRTLERAVTLAERQQRLPEEQRTDPLAPFRQAVYDLVAEARQQGGSRTRAERALGELMPWGQKGWRRPLSVGNVRWLLNSMAETATTEAELSAIFLCMDAARDLGGIPQATDWAGGTLIDRASGKRPTPPLPAGWSGVALAACTREQTKSSATYWATAMLEAAGRHVRPPEREDRAQGQPEQPGPELG